MCAAACGYFSATVVRASRVVARRVVQAWCERRECAKEKSPMRGEGVSVGDLGGVDDRGGGLKEKEKARGG